MAAEYQKHLPNLIRDLRKDLGKPELPVVVAAIGWDGTHAAPVCEAQLAAAGSSNKITAVDTRPFLRAPEVSPGTHADLYHQNAESWLEIGDAIGKAMLELQQK
jgi:alpha-galactosidase